MRRRRRQQLVQQAAQNTPTPEPVDPRIEQQYHSHNQMRSNGIMPHAYEGDGFIEYLILNGMSEDAYWINVEAAEAQAQDIAENGMPIPTDRLTDDQKGWAKADYYDHFTKETARWRPVPGKDSKVVPFKAAPILRDREYNTQCEHGADAKLILWGYRWDMKELHQCQLCGEVIIKSPFSKAATANGNKENYDNETGHVAAESDHAA